MASNNFFSSLGKKIKEQQEETEKKIQESLNGINTSSSKSNTSDSKNSQTESKGLKKTGSNGLSQTVTSSSGNNNNVSRSIGSSTSDTSKQKSTKITNADKLLSGVKSGISAATKTATTTATKPTTAKKQSTSQANSTLKKNAMAGVNTGITSGLKKTSASKIDKLLNPSNKTKTTTAKITGTGVLEDVEDNDQILSIMDANKNKAAEEKKKTAGNNLTALFNLGFANERMQAAFGNLGSWLGGTTKEVENATEYGMARKDIQAQETAKEQELNNALKADIKDLSEGQRQIRRDYLNQNNNEIDLKIQETKEKLEELNKTTEKVSSLNNYLYTDEYESQLESALGDEYGRYLLENEIDERDLPLSQYQGIWAENRTNEYENLQNTIQGYEMQKKNNQADLDELDYYDKLGTKYGAMTDQEKRKAYIAQKEQENAELQAEVDLADQYVRDFTEGKVSIYKTEQEAWEANQETINKKQQILDNQKEIEDLRRTFGILDDDIEDDANYHEEYYGGFNRYYNPNTDRNGTGPQYDTNDINRIVSFINDGEEYEMWSTRNGVGLKAYITGDYSGAGAMLDSEREQLTKLYNAAMAEGREPVEAQAFFTALQPTLNARLRVYEELSNRVTARTFPILSTLGSVAASATQLPLAIMTAYGAATGADWVEDPNGWLGANTRMQQDIESQVAEDLGPVGGFVYKGAVSGAKNFLRGIMYGPLGGHAAEIGTLAQFFGEAFYQNYFDTLEKTHNVSESALKSLLNAGVSTITEIVSVEKMYGDASNWWQYFLQNVSAEMGEEGEEAILSPLLNRLFFGTDEIEERSLDYFRQMQEQGYFTDKDGNKIKLTDDTIGQASYMAWEQATKGYINESVEGMLIAGLSAGGSSMVGAFNNLAENRNQNKQAGEIALTHGIEKGQENTEEGKDTYYSNARQILEAGKNMPVGSESQKLAAEITSEIREGSGINKEKFGKLVRTILSETDNKITNVARDVLMDNIRADLADKGVENQTAYRIASIITKKVVGEDLTDAEKYELYQSQEGKAIAVEYGVGLSTGMAGRFDMGRVSTAANAINEKTAAETAAHNSVMELLTEPKANVTADAVKKIVSGAVTASKDDIKNAEGQRTGNATETVSEGKIADITGIALKSVDVEVEGDDGKPKTEQQTRWQVTMSDGRVVDIADVKATNQDVAETLAFLQNDSGQVVGQNLADAVMKIATTKKAGKAGGDMATTLSGAVRIMWAAATEQATPKISGMSAEDTKAITDAVAADMEDSEKKRTTAFTVLAAGKGTTTLNGVAYGTNAFNEMVNKVVRDNNLGDNVKTEAQVIGSIAKSVGAQVELYYDANDTANQGMFTAGGGIRINLAGTTNKEGAHRSALATFAHEVTHNIEANSPEAYKALRSFVFSSLGGKLNIQNELSRIQAAYAHYGEHLDLAGAVSELVAKACETVLTDENVIRQLQEQDADLAGTVGDAVTELVGRVQSIKGDALTSASMYARAMGDVSRGLSQAWMGAYKEAAGAKGTTTAAGKAQASRSENIDENGQIKTEGSDRSLNPIDTGKKREGQPSANNIIENDADIVKMDEQYRAAVESGDIETATEMLMDKLRKTNGVIPFMAPEWHSGESRRIAESLKLNDPEAIEAAAQAMKDFVPENAVLIPMPGSSGKVAKGSWTMNLTNRIAELTGRPVVVALEGAEHESRQKAKSRGDKGASQEELGFRKVAEIPEGTIPIFIDNTVGSGVTADAAREAMGGGMTLAFTKTLLSPGIRGLKNAVVTYESKKNGGGLIPLSQRFNVEKRDVRYSISDEAYMDAVRAGDMDEAQRMVDEAAEQALKDSKIRGEDGKLIKVYHNTDAEFTVFKPEIKGGKTGRAEGFGIYLTDDQSTAEAYGSRQIAGYVNITRPAYDDRVTITKTELINLIKKSCEYQADMMAEEDDNAGIGVAERSEYLKDTWISNYIYTHEYGKSMDALYREAAGKVLEYNDNDQDIINEIISGMGIREYFLAMDFYKNILTPTTGIDGIWAVWENKDKGLKANIFLAFESSQVKMADPVVYDDDGNVIPLSERFNTAKGDIRYSISDNENENEITNSDGEVMAEVLTGGSVSMYSLRTWEDTDLEELTQDLIARGFKTKDVKKWIADVNGIAAMIAADKDRLDYQATNGRMLKNNQEYVRTLDASTLCAKRLLYQGIYNEIQHMMPDAPLLPEDLINLINMMKKGGLVTPCGICYVESRRRMLGQYASEWLKTYDGAYKPTLEEVTTTDGLESLRTDSREDHRQAYDDFVAAMNAKGSANPKVVQLRTDYKPREIRDMSASQIQKVKDIGGLRVQSFSDFEVVHLIDMMQAVLDMAAMDLTSQAYTKVPEFAWVFGGTGIKINLSLIGKGTGVDANGNLMFDDVEGMPFEKAMELRQAYSENVGTILVGMNDEHIIAAMGDDRIDMIIPFHKSGWSKREMGQVIGMASYKDYTRFQNEKVIAYRKENGRGYKTIPNKKSKISNFNPVGKGGYWDWSHDGIWNAENYLKKCAEANRMPKFANFLIDNGDGSFRLPTESEAAGNKRLANIRKGYWKLLTDFKMYDNEGNGAAQQTVQPNFNMDRARDILNNYEGGANKLPTNHQIALQFVREYREAHKRVRLNTNMIRNNMNAFAAATASGTPIMEMTEEEAMEEFFTPKKQVMYADAQHSIQDEMDYDVQSWMETVPEWSLKTEAEKTLIQDYKSLRMKMRLDQERESQTLADIRKLEELLAGPAEGSVTRPETMENALEAAGVQIKPADPTKILSNPTLIKNGKIIGFIFGDDRVRVSNKADPAIFEEMGFAVDRKTKMATYVNPEGNQMGNTATKKKLEALKIKLQNIRNSLEKTRVKLAEITSGEGFGGMMYRQQQVLNDLLYNKTQGEVQDSVERMQKRAEAVARTIEQNQKTIAEMEKGGIVQKLKEILGTTTAEQAVRELKQMTNSTWTRNEITPLFNEIVLKMTQGQDYQQEIENLAGILVNSSKDNAALDEDLSALRGMTLIISEGQLKELRGQGSSLKEIRQRLAGTGITVKTGEYSSLTDNLDDTIAEYGPALFQDLGDEKDALENFVTRVEQRRNDAIVSNQYAERLANTMAQIAAKAAGVAQGIYMPSDRTAQKQVLAMIEFVKGLAAQTQQAQKTLQGIADDMAAIQKEGRQASGMAGALARDVNVALDYYSRINQVAQESARNQRQQAIIEQLKSKQAEKILKSNEEWRQLIARDAQARKQTEENAKTRGKINTVVKRMYNLLKNPQGTRNIPENMQGIARTVLESIVGNDLGGLKLTRVPAKDLAEISRVLRAWTERDGAPTMPTASEIEADASLAIIEQDVQKIRDGISQYNADIRGANKVDTLKQRGEILKGIQEALSEIYTRIRTENEVFVRGRQVQVANAAADVLEGTDGKDFREWSGFFGRKLAALHKMIVSGNMTPEYFFRTLSNNGLTALWGNYHDAENRNGLELAKSKARMAEIAEEYGYDTWDMKSRQTVKLASGDVQMTLGQIMSLWATWNREQQLGPEMSSHLTSGGFYTEEQDLRDGLLGRTAVQKKAHRVTEEDMDAIEGMLTQEQKDFVNAVVRYMSNDMSELGNEASMAAYGIKMYKEKYYFPMQMWDGIKSRKSNDAAQGASIDRAFHPSFSKSRTHGANNALVIGDFMQVATDHIAGMINYATMGLANESMQKVLNYTLTEGENAEEATKRNVRARLEEAYGKEAMQYLLELQKQLNGGAVRIEKTIYDKLISTFRKNAVAGSLSVALQQPLSYVRAAMLINPKYLAAALSPTNWKGSYKEMMQYSGVAVIKDMGRFDMNAGQSAREYLMPEGKESTGRKAWNKFEEGVTILPELMDRMTWTRMWSAVKAEQKAQHPDMSATSEEFLQMCGERFNDVMRRTQVYDSVLVKSANMRNQNPFIKSMTSFMAEPTLTLNVLADAVRAAKTGETGGKGLLIKAGATFMLSAVLQAAIKGLMGSGRNPDDKKTWEENFLYRFFSSFISEVDPLQLIPGFNDLITVLKDGKLEDDAMSTVGKFFTAISKTKDVITGNSDKGWYRDLEDSAGQLVQLFSGVPLKNLMRDGRAMYNFVTQPYAQRATSGNVIANQTADLFWNADNFVGVVNNWLGDAGYKTDNAAYKERIYEAMRDGNEEAAQNYIDYLLNGKGVKSEESIMKGTNSVTSYTLEDYQAGNITRTRADELLKIANPKMKDQDRAKKLDEIDYESKTGKEVESYSLYTPLFDAMDSGNTSEIDAQKKHLTEVGVKESTITSNMKSHIKSRYEAGEITRTQAEELYKKYAPTMKQTDIIKALDEVDYEKETGEDVDSYSLYTRIYNAVDSGDAGTIKSQKSYLKSIGIDEKDANSQIASYISGQYKEGKLKKTEAESKLKNYAGLDANESFWTLDRIDYKKETGKDAGSGKYYRLWNAMDNNKATDIQSAIKTMTSHGVEAKNIKSQISSQYKQQYLAANDSGKTQIRDAMNKAYKALGYSESDVNKVIKKWK